MGHTHGGLEDHVPFYMGDLQGVTWGCVSQESLGPSSSKLQIRVAT